MKNKKLELKNESKPIIILVEGNTEEYYFTGLRSYIHSNCLGSGKNIKIEISNSKGNYKQLFKIALAKSNYEKIFIVFDRECESKRSQIDIEKHINNIEKLKSNIKVIISNQSFELFLILHFQPFCKCVHNLDEYYNILSTKLGYKSYVEEGKKDKKIFEKLKEFGFKNAKENSHNLIKLGGDKYNEPYTGAYLILEYLKI